MSNGHTRYELIVFDLDGTLLDTLDDLTAAVNAALRVFQLPTRTRTEIRSFIGDGVRMLIRRAVGFAHESEDAIITAFRSHYTAHCTDETKPYAGVTELLARLRERGVKTAILSNKVHDSTVYLAELYFNGLLDDAQGENERAGIPKKPDPTALWAMLERQKVSREKTLYIGDSEVDICTAKNAGVDCVSVTWGFKDERFLLANGAKKIARTSEELARLLLEGEEE